MQVLIIGAGLSGLTTAYRLHQQGIAFTIVEARSRLGGRILTQFPESRPSIPLDMGATWIWHDHKHIKKLLSELRIKRFPQYTQGYSVYDHGAGTTPQQFMPPQEQQAYRIIGGMQTLIQKLYKRLPEENIHLNTPVTHISSDKDGITAQVTQDDKTLYFDADYIINTLPPALASTSISYHPTLPSTLMQALRGTHTWMGQAMKVFLVYDTPFWRRSGLSGYSISHFGIMGEIHDVSPEGQPFGVLFGFLGNDSRGRNIKADERKQAIMTQMKRLYGWQAKEVKHYGEYNWTYETYTLDTGISTPPLSGHPDYGHPALQEPTMDGRLFWGSSETATVSGGYMDGAVYRANQIVTELEQTIKSTL